MLTFEEPPKYLTPFVNVVQERPLNSSAAQVRRPRCAISHKYILGCRQGRTHCETVLVPLVQATLNW